MRDFDRRSRCSRSRVRDVAIVAALVCASLSLHAGARAAWAAPAPRLRLAGWPLSTREAEGWFAAALRAPADTVALAAALARAETRLQGSGWLDAHLAAEWSADSATLLLRAEPGTRRRWGRLTLAVPGEDSARFAPYFHWPLGEPVDP